MPDAFGSVASSSPNSDRRNGRSRGMLCKSVRCFKDINLRAFPYLLLSCCFIVYLLPIALNDSFFFFWQTGSYLPSGLPNGTHKPGLYPAGYPMPRVPLPAYHGAPLSQPYAIPTRGAVHGPVGAVPHGPQPGNRGFGAGRGSSPIGGHLSHQQSSRQPIGSLGPTFNFSPLENPNSQPSVGGPLSQPGFVSNVRMV